MVSVDDRREKRRVYMREWRRKNPDKIKAIKAREYKKNSEKYHQSNAAWVARNKEKSNDIKRRYYERHKELIKHKQAVAQYHRKTRERCIQHYGKICACCGEDQYEFLALHHVNGNGNMLRKHQGHRILSLWLVRNGFPEGFRVLCHNCNAAIGFYGYCPHEIMLKKVIGI